MLSKARLSRFSSSKILPVCVLALAVLASARAAGAQTLALDAKKAGRLDMYRAQIEQQEKTASPADVALDKRRDDQADGDAIMLRNKYYDGRNGVQDTQFYNVESGEVKAIQADPNGYASEMQATAAQIDAELAGAPGPQTMPPPRQKPPDSSALRPAVTSGGVTQVAGPYAQVTNAMESIPVVPIAFGVIVIALAGGAGFFVMKRRKSRPATNYSSAPQFQQASAAQAPPPPRAASAPVVNVPANATMKERLFTEQRAKYQARYNDAADEVTAITSQLGQAGAIPATIDQNLKLLSKSVEHRMKALVETHSAGIVKILFAAAVLAPVWRLFKRGGCLLKLAIIAALWVTTALVYQMFVVLQYPLLQATSGTMMLYIPVFVLCFFFEWRFRVRGPLAALHAQAGSLKPLAVAHIYENQVARMVDNAPAFSAVRVSSSANPLVDETFFRPAPNDQNIVPGAFLLTIGRIATYRMAPNGAITPVWAQPGDFINQYGSILTQAVGEQTAFALSTVPALQSYAALMSRKREAGEQLPRMQQLVTSVDRMAGIWRDVYVEDKVFEFLIRRIDLFNVRDTATPSGILLYGYPGTGKAFLAKKIADSVGARLEVVDPNILNSADSVKGLWQRSRGKTAVVLFVDAADQLFPKPGSENQGSGTREAILAWITEWGKLPAAQSNVWVILSAASEKDLHPSVLSQIGGSKIEISAPSNTGREMILRTACRENQLPADLPAWLVASTSGCSVRELFDVVKEAKLLSIPNAPNDAQWRDALKTVRGSDAQFRDDTKTWDRLVLPADIKAQLQRACKILQEADRYREKKINVPNILLFGPPGTGKTDIARTLANVSGVKFIKATTGDLKAQYVGQSAPLVRAVFSKARAVAPSLLFIDEIENVTAKRGSANADAFTQDVVNEMLDQMDGVVKSDRQVFVLAATNLPEQIDEAILSRFTSKIEIPLPDEAGRCEMFKRLLAEKPLAPSLNVDEVSAVMAKKTPRKSGRDIVKIVDRAMERAAMESDSPDDIALTREALLAEVAPQAREVPEAELQKIWSQIVLKPEIKETILSKIRMFNAGDKAFKGGLLLYGPPGTGKTEIARRIADSASCFFMNLTAADLKAGYVGQSGQSVKKIWEKARQRGRCVIFVDECDAVFTRRGGTSSDAGTEEVVPQFLAEWDGVGSEGQIMVVGATNQRQRLDDAILSRFGAGGTIEIGLPEASQRVEILRLEMQKMERQVEIPDFVARATTGFAGRDLNRVAGDVCSLASERHTDITPDIWKDVIARYAKGASESVDESARWESLILADSTIDKLQTICESLKQMEVLHKQGIEPPRGALLYGPPGTGKTQIARTLANESGLAFIAGGPSDIKAGYIGQSGLKVHELFERARAKSPAILFIDEIETGAARRGGPKSDQFTDEIVTQMLTELDGVKKSDRPIFVLAATNHPDQVDEAILSRFIDKIELPNPDADQRRRILITQLAKKRVDFDVPSVAAEVAARMSDTSSGRDVFSFVERATQTALRRALKAGKADQVILTRDDLLAQLGPAQSARTTLSEEEIQKVWSDIVLKPQIKDSLISKIRMFNAGDKAAPRGLLLYGPPGTGKTEIAQRVAKSANCQFKALTAADLKAGYIGQSGQAVKKIWDEARAYGRCVIFIDECDTVFHKRGSLKSDSGTDEVVGQFLAEWVAKDSGPQIWVIGATNQRDLIDPAILSRFAASVEIGMPEAAERVEILRLEMQKVGRPAEVPDFVARATTGFAGRDLSQVARDICTMAAETNSPISQQMWHDVIARYAKSGSESVDDSARWSSLVLPEEVIDKLQTICESLKYMEVLLKQGIQPPRGALVYGPPGTGKTQIARTMANESGLAFIAAGPSDLKGGYIGQSGQMVHEVFERARGKAPAILFIDEIESSAAARGSAGSDQFSNEIVTQMLTELDGVKKTDRPVFLLAATNHREMVDSAILSRFTEQIEIPRPDADQRRRLFEILLAKKRTDFDTAQLAQEIAPRVGDISGRDIYSIVERSAQLALRRALKAGRPDQVILSREDVLAQISGMPPKSASSAGAGAGSQIPAE